MSNVTRFSTLNSCIDLIFTDSLSIAEHGTLDVNLSDHQMIFLTRKHVSKPKVSSTFSGRSYNNLDENQYVATLKDKNWGPFYSSTNPNTAWTIMKQFILTELDTMCPIRSFNSKQMKDPWKSLTVLELKIM